MVKSILIQETTPEEFTKLINKGVKREIEKLKQELLFQKDEEQLFTRNEACEFLKIDPSTLWAWTKKGKVTAYGIVNRRYYKKSELLNCLTPVFI